MKSARLVLGLVIGIVLFAVLVVVVIGPSDDEDACTPDSGVSAGEGGVPDGELSLPLKEGSYTVSSPYKSASRPGHRGIDLAAPDGTPMYAMADGVVAQAGPAGGFGQWIVLDHTIDGAAYSTVYGHMWDDGLAVKTGDRVKAGQFIGEVGSNGGSTGPHLHFEVWDGGRLSGGSETDPQPWLDRAVNPGSGDGAEAGGDETEPDTVTERDEDKKDDPPREMLRRGGDLPPSKKILSEDKLQVDSIRIARTVAHRFPDVQTIGGWRPVDKFPDHPSGRAVDIMIPNFQTDEGRELGNRIKNYLFEHREEFNIEYMIWRQMYIPASGQPNLMEDRFSLTQNHFDHVHVTTVGGGMPKPNQRYAPGPSSGADNTSETTGGSGPDGQCESPHGDDALAEGEIPEELRKWIALGGKKCRAIDAPLLAGLIYHESAGFQANAVSTAGAQGYGQFMPRTWAGVGAKVDENGEIAGPPGSGSPSDPADATMAAARYLCQIAEDQAEGIASGELKGDPRTLMLAGYNAGPGAVEQYGGVPPFLETQKYVVIVPEKAKMFTKTAGDE